MAVEDGEDRRVTLPEDEWFRLKQEALLSDLEVKLDNRLKRRFTVLLVIVAVVSYFGIQTITGKIVDDRIDPHVQTAITAVAKVEASTLAATTKSNEATALAEQARKASEDALEKSTKALVDTSDQLEKVEERRKLVDKQVEAWLGLGEKYEAIFSANIRGMDEEWGALISRYKLEMENITEVARG